MSHPFSGITILDLTQIYNGPYATFLLGQAGADVIKVEPLDGEHLRKRQGASGAAMPFAMLNANKRTMTLNLKTPQGRDLLLRLVEQADVLVENFAPGVMERLDLGETVLREANPRLIYAAGSGYGKTGPYRDFPAMDLTVQAMTGVIDTTGYPDMPPVKAGPAIADFLAGIHLFGAIAAALFARERTGKGCSVEVSMMESVYPTLASSLGLFYGSGGGAAMRTGNRHTGMSLCPYNVYPTSDGYIAIITNDDRHWLSLTEALGCPELAADPRFCTVEDRCARMDEVDALVAEQTRGYTKDELFGRLIGKRVPCAPVRTLTEVVNDPHLHARGSLRWIDHPEYGHIVVPSSPLRFSGEESVPYKPSSALGEDTDAILSGRLSLSDVEIGQLRAKKVI
ncbi:CaiB/BaiF CoA transferase family protein [Rhodoferax sp.]|uniref:CaiB/BaiF CoA transferase family protein n=1 Tax=Rhodoferax sp. TaxID=50421 RepID=UPI00272F18D9|nr:CoA transferase [Rhodoferax sp.]MDP2443753.1 CoA transferase [Rhodoferax sp.]MDZ4207774.1 CoA transferase [Rhodoferax sp.]